eukprot:CAMPEP_0198258474 /NCGR_PEP_ID=MMETSP1447-20131203/7885_1 /TAXON_ID=420782 /ORGANISM="Chaetoceros dichaeta, Strain CCMP1751" /LENGTH=797 /DNA_ID=CAMNT_0043945599 /DNA_START=251 /DNA_END=2644 /DNA_ORIENTATION=+
MMVAANETPENTKPKLTKRQKRKLGPNPTNTWPQQPKIKSEAARDKAYLANAGFTPATTSNTNNARGQKRKTANATGRRQQTTPPQPLDPQMDVLNSPEFKFGRLLASPEARTRHATILKLQAYLQARCAPYPREEEGGKRKKRRTDGDDRDDDEEEEMDEADDKNTSNTGGHFRGLSELDLLKLWKGLWHTLYLCDGVAVQTEVSKVLAKLLWSLAGSEEQDEYAGRLYLEVDDEDGSVEWGEEEGEAGDEDAEVAEKKMIREDAISIIVDGNNPGSSNNSSSSEDEGDDEDEEESQDETDTKHCRGAHLSQLFIRTYFQTLSREWYKMDKYRIDKFYTLTRLILRETYRFMAARHWNLGIIRLFNDALFEEVLRPSSVGGVGGGGGNGVRFHLLDICLEELALVNAEEETGLKLTEATLLDCLEPFFAMVQRVQDKIVHDRVMEKVVSRFLMEYSVVSDNYHEDASGDEEDEEADEDTLEKRKLVMGEVHVSSVAQFIFELASDSKTLDRYRKELYEMHKTYVRRIKEVGRDVSLDDDEDDEMSGVCEDVAEDVEEKIEEEENMKEVVKEKEENEDLSSKKAAKDKKRKRSKSKAKAKAAEEADVVSKEKERVSEEKLVTTSSKDNDKEEVDKETDKDTSSSKKKRKKKKKKNKTPTKEVVKDLRDEKEDIITISVNEQNEAASAATKLKEAAAKKLDTSSIGKTNDVTVDPNLETPKKVKFRKLNTSKSYKASMKDLKKIDHKAERTPEKSILLKKIDEDAFAGDTPQSLDKKSSGSKKKRKKSKSSKRQSFAA